jgi:nitroimidazol reductase NimA-like FMN-containing flavoprotein (pyridoxamine 5'-phosphate oxidase superfamily)
MRRKDRQISPDEAWELLDRGEFGVLGMVTAIGTPYAVPVNYCVIGGEIYFHCAMEGRKIELMRQNPHVSFTVVGRTRLLPDRFATSYESCLVLGRTVEAFADDKQAGLEGLVQKYSPDFIQQGHDYIDSLRDQVRVFKISIDSISGKARR